LIGDQRDSEAQRERHDLASSRSAK